MKDFIKKTVLVVASAVMLVTGTGVAAPAAASAAASPCPYIKYKKVICVNKAHRVLVMFENGKPTMWLDARFGAPDTPTREGFFRVYRKSPNHVSSISGTAMPYSMFFSGGQAIHYSQNFADYAWDGSSLGCVNTRNLKATKALYDRTPIGTPVVVYKGIK
jgi:hypothetical protein